MNQIRLMACVVAALTLGYIAYQIYDAIYDRGFTAAATQYEQQAAKLKLANDLAIKNAEATLKTGVDAILREKERLEDEVERLNREALEDPNADACGVKRSGVQRINAVR